MSKTTLNFEDHLALTQLYANYASAVDSGNWQLWPEFFTDECSYKVQPRENFDRGFPLCTLSLDSKAMIKDRVYGIEQTLFHDPYYPRHVIGAPIVRKVDDERIECEANYAVFRTKLSGPSTVYNVGRYLDTVVRTPQGFKFAAKLCVYDSEMIPNSLIYPI
jgi:salicylate 5-hydroxylase small subunit